MRHVAGMQLGAEFERYDALGLAPQAIDISPLQGCWTTTRRYRPVLSRLVLRRDSRDHFWEIAVGAIGRVRQAEVLKDLQQTLLLIEKFCVSTGLLDSAKESAANDLEVFVTKLRS